MVSEFRRALFVGVLLLPSFARAGDPSAADRENARTYMAEGRAKRDSNDLKAALRAFQAADAIMHVPTTAYEVAKTEAMLGMLVEARDEALQIARSPTHPGEPPPFGEARTAAQKLSDEIEPRIPSIRVVLKNGVGASISIDDVALPAVAVGMARKLDPGAHVVVAKLGTVERRINVQVLEREAKDVPLDMSESAQPSTAVATNPVTTPTTTTTITTTPVVDTHAGPWISLGITALVVGGAGVVVGGVTGAMSISQTNAIAAQCPANHCPTTLSNGKATSTELESARTLATISDVGFIAGGVLAALGIGFVVVGASHKSHAPAAAFRFGPGNVTFAGTF